MACNICNSEKYKILGKPRLNAKTERFFKDDYRIVRCKSCSFYYVVPAINIIKQDKRSYLYDENYFNAQSYSAIRIEFRNKEIAKRFSSIEKYQKIPVKRFLDFGCGQGATLKYAIHKGWEPFGIDISDNLAPNVDRHRICFRKGDLANVNFPDDFFDLIYADSVLEHVENPIEILFQLKRKLRPGGTIFIIVPNEDCLVNKLIHLSHVLTLRKKQYAKIKPFIHPYHVVGFNKTSLNKAFSVAKLNVERITDFGGDIPFWKFCKKHSRPFMLNVMLAPLNLFSIIIKNQIQLEAICSKPF